MYKVNAARSRVRRELRQIPKQDLERIGEAVNALAEEPRLWEPYSWKKIFIEFG